MKRGRVQYRRIIEFEDRPRVSDEFEFPLSDSHSSLWETGLKPIFLLSRPSNIVLEFANILFCEMKVLRSKCLPGKALKAQQLVIACLIPGPTSKYLFPATPQLKTTSQ